MRITGLKVRGTVGLADLSHSVPARSAIVGAVGTNNIPPRRREEPQITARVCSQPLSCQRARCVGRELMPISTADSSILKL